MDKLAQHFVPPHRIDLAQEADFMLGGLRIRPSRCEVVADGERRVLQRKVMQVLVALARSSTEVVSQRELILRCWGGLSVSEDAIGRCIGQLRRLSAQWPRPPFEIETIPGVGYRLEATGGARPSPADQSAPGPAVRFAPRPWILAGLACAIAAVTLLAFFLTHPRSSDRAVKTPSIAVVGFEAPGGGADAKALAATLTSQVTDALSRYEVTVIGSPAGQGDGPSSAPGADFVVRGRVVERDHRLSVTTDLSDPHDNVLVYSFDTAQPGGKGDLAGEIANHVALSLDPTKLSNDLSGKLTSLDYTLVARANDGIDRWDMPYVLDQAQKLALRHPQDGDLHAAVAISAVYAAQSGPPSQQPQLLQLARRIMGEAQQLSPHSGMLVFAKSMLVNGPMAYAQQEQLMRKSISLSPSFHVTYNGLGEMLLMVGRESEGASLIQRSVELDPMSGVVVNAAVADFVKAGRPDDARRLLDREEQIWPGDWRTVGSEFNVAFYQGTPQQTVDFARRHVPPKGSSADRTMSALGLDAWLTRDPGAIKRMIENCFVQVQKPARPDIGDPTPQLVAPDCLIQMVRLGAMDDAFRFAALAYPDHRSLYPVDSDKWITEPWQWPDPSWLFVPPMQPFREDPRFWDVAARSGLVDYWQETGSWPDFCMPQLERCKSQAAAAARANPPKSSAGRG
jgi:DNA-binding winged helix-turn-helix (wHTH) protein